jgi:cell division protein FtsB
METIEGYNVLGTYHSLCSLMEDIDRLHQVIEAYRAENLGLQDQVADLKAELDDWRMGVAA